MIDPTTSAAADTIVRGQADQIAPAFLPLPGPGCAGPPAEAPAGAGVPTPKGPAPAGAAAEPPLDSTQNNCVPLVDSVSRRRIRWAARALLWRASLLKSVRCCGAQLRAVRDGSQVIDRHAVEVRRQVGTDGQARAGFGGLMTCGSPWACPRCSAVIAATRSVEIGNAVRACQSAGGTVYMLTLTLRHRATDQLSALFELLNKGWRGVTGGHAWTGVAARWVTKRGRQVWRPGEIGDRDRFGVAGVVRVVEATVSRPGSGGHGWHLHIHALVFLTGDASAGLCADWADRVTGLTGCAELPSGEWIGRAVLAARIVERWASAVHRAGGRVPLGAACDLRRVEDQGAEFLGGYLTKSTLDVAARLGAEIAAGGETKVGSGRDQLTPFELLRELAQDGPDFGVRTPRRWALWEDGTGIVDIDTGEITEVFSPGLWRLWHEWEVATRGRRAITWSRPRSDDAHAAPLWSEILRARGRSAEDSDETVAEVELHGIVLGEISRSEWFGRLVWRPSWLVAVIEAAERGSSDVRRWMDDNGITYASR